jgi:hypothetical protein
MKCRMVEWRSEKNVDARGRGPLIFVDFPFIPSIRGWFSGSWTIKFLRCEVVKYHAQPPTWRTRASLFVWLLPPDLSGLGAPTSSYATAGIALRVSGALKPHHHDKVETLSAGCSYLMLYIIGLQHGSKGLKHVTLDIFNNIYSHVALWG